MTVSGIEAVGSYAIQINWQDGHNTGIYEYPFLKNLAADSIPAKTK
ncbi:MAG: gamma-butyrobetaine hydroxylase-like domain-containing protein [Ignavibacteriaceae bacterium]